ncbi:hypothetical protein OV079_01190 [Nannocystis pusilla]|uniref:Uncharacterized protein n=1 Tax=Nannocystis pusilla TaxID=889268 RepID=A0A9X3ERS8_9BACT|nr:hypothetical protein [Nannocystis pusilla]MCY1004203.1 hypothetical protein [Nannocystis pusilla]
MLAWTSSGTCTALLPRCSRRLSSISRAESWPDTALSHTSTTTSAPRKMWARRGSRLLWPGTVTTWTCSCWPSSTPPSKLNQSKKIVRPVAAGWTCSSSPGLVPKMRASCSTLVVLPARPGPS